MEETEQSLIKGELIYTIYQNANEHFSIAKVKVIKSTEKTDEDEVVVKGYLGDLQFGETYVFYGDWIDHKKFGRQFQVDRFERYIPKTTEGLVTYLSSELFPKIGKKTAENVVGVLGDSTISKILNNGQVLDTVPNLSEERKKILKERLAEYQGFDLVVLELQKVGIGLKLAQKIYQAYQSNALEQLRENPYQFVFDVEGFGFHRADLIAQESKMALNHPSRIRAGVLYSLNESINEGHVYLPQSSLIERVNVLLESHKHDILPEMIDDQIIEMDEEDFVVKKDTRIYLPVLYYAEAGFTTQLRRLTELEIEDPVVEADLLKIVGQIEEEDHLTYGKNQYRAIKEALNEKVMILTGGPGTGKTTVIKGILKAFSQLKNISMDLADYGAKKKFPYILTAPTGRAAKRMTESTGLPAYTIHRLLGWDGHEGFEKNDDNPLTGKIIIVDEFSMVDIFLANQLFKAIPNDMQILLVGDEDQLPSVGPGQVLADLIASQQIKKVKLDEVYRQKEGSKIISIAHKIKNDDLTINDIDKANDFNFIPCQKHQILEVIETIILKAKAKGLEMKDIEVLAPMYKTDIGIHEINKRIQEIVNPKRKGVRELFVKDVVLRTGDKVIQLVNQPEDNVFNGDIGQITAIFRENENVDQKEQVIVTFDEEDVSYAREDLLNITHAYCISIHKSQGSEFPIVILPIDWTYRRMLKKNLLYTAITRAKQSLIVCGDKQAFLTGVKSIDHDQRFTTLVEKLTGVFTDESYREALEEDVEANENLSPFDFL